MEEVNFPHAFICPISLSLFSDPVILGHSGHTFERAEIQAWLMNHDTNPITNQQLIFNEDRELVPNYNLRQSIEYYVQSFLGKNFSSVALTIIEIISVGFRKRVFLADLNGEIVVVLKANSENFAERECKVFLKVGYHPHLVRFVGRTCMNDDDEIVSGSPNTIVTEWLPLGHLYNYFEEQHNKILTMHHMLLIAEQVADGMISVHAAGIIHRDLTTRNIMVFSLDPNFPTRTVVKVGGYGYASLEKDQFYNNPTFIETYKQWRRLPPEILRSNPWCKQCDIWEYGILLYNILTQGRLDYDCYVDQHDEAKGEEKLHIPRPPTCPNDVWQVVENCWAIKPEDRPSFIELKAHLQELRSKYASNPESPVIPDDQTISTIAAARGKESFLQSFFYAFLDSVKYVLKPFLLSTGTTALKSTDNRATFWILLGKALKLIKHSLELFPERLPIQNVILGYLFAFLLYLALGRLHYWIIYNVLISTKPFLQSFFYTFLDSVKYAFKPFSLSTGTTALKSTDNISTIQLLYGMALSKFIEFFPIIYPFPILLCVGYLFAFFLFLPLRCSQYLIINIALNCSCVFLGILCGYLEHNSIGGFGSFGVKKSALTL